MSTSAPEPSQQDATAELARLGTELRDLHPLGYYDDNPPLRSCAWGCSTCKTEGACPTRQVLSGLNAEETKRA